MANDHAKVRVFQVFLFCLAIIWPIQNDAQATERVVDLELVLAADISGSMDLEEATLQRIGFVSALRHPDVIATITRGRLGRIALTYVEWAGYQIQSTLVDWREISDARSANAFADALEKFPVRTAYWTSISNVIEYASDSFENSGFSARRRIIDVSGDGPNNSGLYVPYSRDRAVTKGIVINGLPIINDRLGPYGFAPMPNLDLYYEDCVIGGQGAFVIVANGFKDFARAIRRKMILEIAGLDSPKTSLFHLATERTRQPCDAGETQLRIWRQNRQFDELD
jgi:hypothetical protein